MTENFRINFSPIKVSIKVSLRFLNFRKMLFHIVAVCRSKWNLFQFIAKIFYYIFIVFIVYGVAKLEIRG